MAPAALAFSMLASSTKAITRTLTNAVGHTEGSTDDLIGLAWIDAELDGDLDGLVELGGRRLLDEIHTFFDAVLLEGLNFIGPR